MVLCLYPFISVLLFIFLAIRSRSMYAESYDLITALILLITSVGVGFIIQHIDEKIKNSLKGIFVD
ncbi:MAG: hypothetical protein FJ356_01980 [Thaumarchaeota archaeon]|nr:hypothetical protein [Nitrososphaerota archaeon]